MTQTLERGAAVRRPVEPDATRDAREQRAPLPWGLLRELERPGAALSNITPNWYAAVMGTGIVAVAATSLPDQFAGLHAAATIVWALAAALLVAITVLTALHWRYWPATARRHVLDPVMAPFYGAPPMAMLTVGAGTLLLGRDVVGMQAAVDVDWVLWVAGTVGGLGTAALIPYLMFTRHEIRHDDAFGGWLMPVVPPMVSASTGALLVPHTSAGQARLTLLLACYAMFGLSLIASIVIITLIWQRLTFFEVGAARLVPTLWIVLGPLGQSITAANLLGDQGARVLPSPYAAAARAFGVIYGVPVWGFAALWAALALAMTVRTARQHLPFSLTWWSFTFPVGTCVTGTAALAAHTTSVALRTAAIAGFGCLVVAWLVVAVRTARGSWRGGLFLPAQTATP